MADKPTTVPGATRNILEDPELQAQMEAIAQAVAQGETPTTPSEETPSEPAAPAGEPTAGQAAEGEPAPATGQEPTAEVPTTYFGVDLSDFEPDVRSVMIERFKEQDKFIQRLLQEKAEREANPPAPAPAPEPTVLTDEAVLGFLGISPDDPDYEAKASVGLPLGKALAQLQEQVQQMQEAQMIEQAVSHWNTTLDKLEREYGALSIDRDDVFEFASSQNIQSPEDAYWRIAGPARKALNEETTKARQEQLRALKLSQQGAIRPASQADGVTTGVEATDVRGATAEALRAAMQELGITADDLKEASEGR